MLYSMTGFGDAQYEADDISFLVEIKSLNNRFLKTVIKVSESISFVEPHIDKLIRKTLARGSVTCTVHMRYTGLQGAAQINQSVLREYLRQLEQTLAMCKDRSLVRVDMSNLMQMPGVCQPREVTEQEHTRMLEIVLDLTEEGTWPTSEKCEAKKAPNSKSISTSSAKASQTTSTPSRV